MKNPRFIKVDQAGSVQVIWLNRPEVRNAFNPILIAELKHAFDEIKEDTTIRAIVLAGVGKAFCAGADLNWMREMANYTHGENFADARDLAGMLSAIDTCPVPVVARVQRAAFGGALGLIACCDSVVASDDCVFAFSEVRLGISPATIAPFVIAKVGASNARDLFLSGERFNVQRALRMGLVHTVVSTDELDHAVQSKLDELLMAAPEATIRTKRLVLHLSSLSNIDTTRITAELIARLRAAPEGQEGLSAFLEKRKPYWQPPSD